MTILHAYFCTLYFLAQSEVFAHLERETESPSTVDKFSETWSLDSSPVAPSRLKRAKRTGGEARDNADTARERVSRAKPCRCSRRHVPRSRLRFTCSSHT